MKTSTASLRCVLAFIAALSGLVTGQTFQISWASNAFATNKMADGITTFEEASREINFELGTFAPGFNPTTASPSEWTASWIILQNTEYDLADQQFINTATLPSNDSPFQSGGQAYIWGYTTKDLGDKAEWILVASPSWKWPDVTITQPAPTFSVGDALPAHAILGAVNPVNGAFHMQLAVVVPEPSSLLLLSLGALLLARRRR